MEQTRIKSLIELIQASDLSELSLSEGGSTLTLSRQVTTPQAAVITASLPAAVAPIAVAETEAPAAAAAAARDIPSPLYGILHLTPAPGEPAFVSVGQRVEAGAVLCIVEAMKMFHQVQAPCAGVVEAVLADAGSEVESGQPLLRMGD